MAHKQNVNICNWDEQLQLQEKDLLKSNWLPICISGVQWYVSEQSVYNNTTESESAIVKIYKQGANGSVTITAPVGSITEGYCSQIHTETLCDVVTATYGGNLTGSFVGSVYTVNTNTITVTNDTVLNYIVDWGNGYTDIGTLFTYDFTSQPSGKYEVKIYAISNNNNIIFINSIDFTWNGVTFTPITTFPLVINRTYLRTVGKAFQNYTGNTPTGSPYLSNGSVYTPIGTLSVNCPEKVNDYLGVADVSLANSASSSFNKEYIYGCEYATHTLTPTVNLNVTATTLTYTATNYNTLILPVIANYITKVIVDWGDGEFELINLNAFGTSYVHTPVVSLPSGNYEARVYIQDEEDNWYLLLERNWTYNQVTNTVTNIAVNTQPITLYRFVRNLLQVRDESTNAITYETDAGVITTIGAGNTYALNCKTPISNLNITTPFLSNGQSLTELGTVTPLENGSQNRIVGVIANGSTTAVNPSFVGARDVTVYNSKNVTIAFEYTTTINGVLHRVNIPSNSTWSNTLKRDDYTNEGTYVAGNIVAAYGATTAAGEVNINWTT